jgi:hypothetical protein
VKKDAKFQELITNGGGGGYLFQGPTDQTTCSHLGATMSR